MPSARMLFPCRGPAKNTPVGGEAIPPSLRGFTLIELILVLVMSAFLYSLVAPAITSTTGLRLKTTVRRLAAGLRFARSQAVITGNTYQVLFDLDNGAMAIEPVEKETPYARGGPGEGAGDTGEEDAEEERRALQRRQEKKNYTMPEDVTLARVLLDGEEISEGQSVDRILSQRKLFRWRCFCDGYDGKNLSDRPRISDRHRNDTRRRDLT